MEKHGVIYFHNTVTQRCRFFSAMAPCGKTCSEWQIVNLPPGLKKYEDYLDVQMQELSSRTSDPNARITNETD